tara:strand:- start:34 stop:831 length:798 start_codon:yes stop_codon:yes gene_type:complete
MKIERNKLSKIPKVNQPIDSIQDLPFIPEKPLPIHGAIYFVGSPGSGKTSTMISMLTSHPTKKNKTKPLYYYKYFDNIQMISGSLSTLPKSFTNKIPEEQLHNKFDDDKLVDIINGLQEDENGNNLLVLDDCIRDINRSKNLSKIFLNRRHITQNPEKEGQSKLSIWVVSQKYSLLPMEFRNSLTSCIIYRSCNSNEIKRIKEELMFDLSPEMQDEVLYQAWKEPYSFLYIIINAPTKDKYYVKFDKIIFDEDAPYEEIDEEIQN